MMYSAAWSHWPSGISPSSTLMQALCRLMIQAILSRCIWCLVILRTGIVTLSFLSMSPVLPARWPKRLRGGIGSVSPALVSDRAAESCSDSTVQHQHLWPSTDREHYSPKQSHCWGRALKTSLAKAVMHLSIVGTCCCLCSLPALDSALALLMAD